MTLRHSARVVLGCGLATALAAATAAIPVSGAQDRFPLAIDTARVSIEGTSNIHPYTASTTAVRVTRLQLANTVAGPEFWDAIVKTGAVDAFEIAIPAATLASPKEGLDKNMHKALKVKEHADITFRLQRIEPRAATPGALRAIGLLQIAGVEREVALDITAKRKDSSLAVEGRVQLLMTDFGIMPPKAMLGMLKTDPKVTVIFETVLTIPLT